MSNNKHKQEQKADNDRRSGENRPVWYVMYYILAAVVIYYFIMASISPVRYVKELNQRFAPDSAFLAGTGEGFATDSLFLSLSRQLAFSQARSRMAQSDSIGLTVNLPDSVVSIEIRGVEVRRVPLDEYHIAGSIRGIEDFALTRFLAEPFTVESHMATIPKQPVMVKIAPRDTAEASAMPDIVPDTTFTEPVFFSLELSSGLRITILQAISDDDRSGRAALNRFINRRRVSDLIGSAMNAALFRFPSYGPEIRIVVPGEDARIIYRSIPAHSYIVLKIR